MQILIVIAVVCGAGWYLGRKVMKSVKGEKEGACEKCGKD